VVRDAPDPLPGVAFVLRVWDLVKDQIVFSEKGKATMNLAAVCPVIAMLNLPPDESMELLSEIKIIRKILNGGKIEPGDGVWRGRE
jgi:hypothetical protein